VSRALRQNVEVFLCSERFGLPPHARLEVRVEVEIDSRSLCAGAARIVNGGDREAQCELWTEMQQGALRISYALNLCTGERLFLAREHQRSEDFQVLLQALRQRYPRGPIALLLDEDTSHTAKVSAMTAADLGIKLVWLLGGEAGRAPPLVTVNRSEFGTVPRDS